MKGKHVVDYMMANDSFSKWLGLNVTSVSEGCVELEFIVRADMLNGFDILHGGVSYSAADSALAFAANTHGIQSVSIETSISHTKAAKLSDIIKVKATELSCSRKIGVYEVRLTNQSDEIIALFKGTVFRTGKEWK